MGKSQFVQVMKASQAPVTITNKIFISNAGSGDWSICSLSCCWRMVALKNKVNIVDMYFGKKSRISAM